VDPRNLQDFPGRFPVLGVPVRSRPVYLLYADESGDLRAPDSNVFVVGGIAVHEDAVRPLAGEIVGTLSKYVGRDKANETEIHGAPMRSGNREWKGLSSARRHGLAHELLKLVVNWEHKGSESEIQPFAIVIDRDHSQSPTETSYGELLFMFDRYLRAGRREGDPHNGILIADRSRYERTLQAWVEVARTRNARPKGDPRRLYALAETPFFVDSRSTRLMQMADLVAYSLYRGYNAGDWRWAKTLLPGLHPDPGRLVHFTSDASCACPACLAEREEVAPQLAV
jgi:Protein of unknown function (DUF3800)